MARKRKYCRFLEAQGAESALSDGAVEQYPRRRQRVYMLRPRTSTSTEARKRQAKRPCLGTEEAAENMDVVPQHGEIT